MPINGGPGQQAIPKPTKPIPATRATGMATLVNSTPNNNRPTSAGTMSNANPVAASATAAKINTFFIAPISLNLFRACELCCSWREVASASVLQLDPAPVLSWARVLLWTPVLP